MMACVASFATTATASPMAALTFKQESSTPEGLPVTIEFGFDHPGGPVTGNAFGGGFAGLSQFRYRIGSIEVDLDDLKAFQSACFADPLCQPDFLQYDLAPDEGSMTFTDAEIFFTFQYRNGRLWGEFRTDAPEPRGCFEGPCTYLGALVAVPEPMAIALLAGALVPLAVRRRRR